MTTQIATAYTVYKGKEISMDRKSEYNLEYAKKYVRPISIKLNTNTDTDILAMLDSVDNIQGYIKELIRKDIEQNNRK